MKVRPVRELANFLYNIYDDGKKVLYISYSILSVLLIRDSRLEIVAQIYVIGFLLKKS